VLAALLVCAGLSIHLHGWEQPQMHVGGSLRRRLGGSGGDIGPMDHRETVLAEARACGKVEENVDYQGSDLANGRGIWAASPTDCARECWSNPACKSYTYAKAQEACWLKSEELPGRVESSCCVSGFRPCIAPPTPPPRKAYNYSGRPVRGVAYAPLPCKDGCATSEDMLQEGYQALWGAAPGRDDLQVVKDLGANAVRLYHSLGLDGRGNHGLFLDRAESLGLEVMPGYHTYNAVYGGCPDWDCFATWKSYTLKSFEQGFRRGNDWAPAVSVLLLFNEPDFFRGYSKTAHAKVVVSALDGILAAEREAGVDGGRVKLSVAWSNAPGTSLDGEVTGLAVWAFHDVATTIANPRMVQYTPRSSQAQLEEAYRTRWAHSINVQTPGALEYMNRHYYRFEPTPWFIGEYGAGGLPQSTIEAELVNMDKVARDPTSPFMGMAIFQFQAAYFKGGSEMNFGLFRLGDRQVGETGDICDKGTGCRKLPVHCLTTERGALPEYVGWRADAVASAWGGLVDPEHMC